MGFGEIGRHDRGDGVELAFERQAGKAPTLVWLSGFKSDMAGTKAQALAEWARDQGRAFLRFDYSGHGQSGGRFEDGTISRWKADTLTILDAESEGPLVLIGSSMGGWLALLAALARPERVKGLLLIAPAADFTEKLMWAGFPDKVKRQILAHGRWERPSEYSAEPYVITRDLIEDGRKHLLLDGTIPFRGPVRILQGFKDPDVPPAHAGLVAERLETDDLAIHYVKDGDHRLSRPEDIAKLIDTADGLARQVGRLG